MRLPDWLSCILLMLVSVAASPAPAQDVNGGPSPGEAVILSGAPLPGPIDRVLVPRAVPAELRPAAAALLAGGVPQSAFGVLDEGAPAETLLRPGTVLMVTGAMLTEAPLAGLLQTAPRPHLYRVKFAAGPVEVVLTRAGSALQDGGGESLPVESGRELVLLVNGDAAQGLSTLYYGGRNAEDRVRRNAETAGLQVARFAVFDGRDARILTAPQEALLVPATTFQDPQFDALLQRAPGLRVYVLREGLAFEEVTSGGGAPPTPAPPVPEPPAVVAVDEPERTAAPAPVTTESLRPRPRAAVAAHVPAAVALTPAPGRATAPPENSVVPVQPAAPADPSGIVAAAARQGEACGAFFLWLSRYFDEYDVDPRAEQDFESQIETLRFEEGAVPPFVRLFRAEDFSRFVGQPYDEVDQRTRNSALGDARKCLPEVLGPDRKVTGSYGPLITYITSRSTTLPWSRTLREKVDAIESAYAGQEALLAEIAAPTGEVSSATMRQWRVRAAHMGDLMWPSDAAAFKATLEERLTHVAALAAENDARQKAARAKMAADATARRARDQAIAAERAKQHRAEQDANCRRMATHPLDPDRPSDVAGQTDEALISQAQALIEDCRMAEILNPGDPGTVFLLGRTLFLSGAAEESVPYLLRAAEGGSAPAFAYLADLDENLESARSLLTIGADLGFTPAEEHLQVLDQYEADLARFAEETRKAEEEAAAAEQAALERAEAAGRECTRLAGHPADAVEGGPVGVTDDDLDPEAAIAACSKAIELRPLSGQSRYELGRALLFVDGLRGEAIEQLRIASKQGYERASFTLYETLDDPEERLSYLQLAAFGGLPEASTLYQKIPKIPTPSGFTAEMVFRDPGRVNRTVESLIFSDDIISYSTPGCMAHMKEYQYKPDFLRVLMEITRGRELNIGEIGWLNGLVAYESPAMIDKNVTEIARGMCANYAETYGSCVDVFLSEFNGDVFDRLDDTTWYALLIANSAQSLSNPVFFDRSVGELTDFIGYVYARRIGAISPFDEAAFNDDYSFADGTDEIVREVVRSVIAQDKLFVIVGAVDNELICK